MRRKTVIDDLPPVKCPVCGKPVDINGVPYIVKEGPVCSADCFIKKVKERINERNKCI